MTSGNVYDAPAIDYKIFRARRDIFWAIYCGKMVYVALNLQVIYIDGKCGVEDFVGR